MIKYCIVEDTLFSKMSFVPAQKYKECFISFICTLVLPQKCFSIFMCLVILVYFSNLNLLFVLLPFVTKMSLCMRKPTIWVSQTSLYSHKLEISDLRRRIVLFMQRKQRRCIADLHVFAYANRWFSHAKAQIMPCPGAILNTFQHC